MLIAAGTLGAVSCPAIPKKRETIAIEDKKNPVAAVHASVICDDADYGVRRGQAILYINYLHQ